MNSEIDSSASQVASKSSTVDKKRLKALYGVIQKRGSYLQSGGFTNDTDGVAKVAVLTKEQILKENDPIKTLSWRISRHRIEIDTLHRTIGKMITSIQEFSEKFSTTSEFSSLNETLKAIQEQLTRLEIKVEKNTSSRRANRVRAGKVKPAPDSMRPNKEWIETPTLQDMVKSEAPGDLQEEEAVAEPEETDESEPAETPVKLPDEPEEVVVKQPDAINDTVEKSSDDGNEAVVDVQDETGSILSTTKEKENDFVVAD